MSILTPFDSSTTKVASETLQPGQYIHLFLQDDPAELSKINDFGTMFWGLVLKNVPDVNDDGELIWVLTLMLENGVSIIQRRRAEVAWIANSQPTEFSDDYIAKRIAESTSKIEALEALISRFKAVQAAVQTS